MEEELIAFGGREYILLLGLLVMARSMDFLSTWIATPTLSLEANPLARILGFKWGVVVNLAICPFVALQPTLAIGFATVSLLVAGRNFQIAWLAQTMGEESYLRWISERLREAHRGLYLFCLLAEAAFFVGVGTALILISRNAPVPLGIGWGTALYAFVVVTCSLLSFWRARRTASPLASNISPDL